MNKTNQVNFGPTFQGIQLPKNVTLPEEFIQAYSYMGLAEIKVTLAAIIHFMRVGWAEPITLSEFESLTGLTRKPVLEGIEAALRRGILVRYEVAGYRGHTSYVYDFKVATEPRRSIGGESAPIDPLVSQLVNDDESRILESDSTTLTDSTSENTEMCQKLQQALRKIGVFPNSANFLVKKFPVETINAFLDIYPEALKLGAADGAGWLVRAIENGWDLGGIREDLQARRDPRLSRVANSKKSHLPKMLLRDLQTLGWSGPLDEVQECFSQNKKLVHAWLDHALHKRAVYANPAGVFRNGLRGGLMPPQEKDLHDEQYVHYEHGEIATGDPENEACSEWQDTLSEDIQTWQAVMEKLQPQVSGPDFTTWVKAARPICLDSSTGTFTLAVANDYARQWLDIHIREIATNILCEKLGQPVRVEFRLST